MSYREHIKSLADQINETVEFRNRLLVSLKKRARALDARSEFLRQGSSKDRNSDRVET